MESSYVPPTGKLYADIVIVGIKALAPPIVVLNPVKNLLAKTTSKPLPDVPDCKGADNVLPDEIYLFSTLAAKETSKPNSENFIFSFVLIETK